MLSQEIKEKYTRACLLNADLLHPSPMALGGCFKSPYTASELELQNWLLSKLPCNFAVQKRNNGYRVIMAHQGEYDEWDMGCYPITRTLSTALEALLEFFENSFWKRINWTTMTPQKWDRRYSYE